ncbi:MAG: AhpC/TSA family protein [Alistipes sp.]|jgi:peroxiredoxin|nr:AhpC/TSA family protein [Alistipes sp.]
MKRHLYFTLAAALVVALLAGVASCGRDAAKLTGRLIGAGGKTIYLDRVIPGGGSTVDSVVSDANGKFRFRVELADRQPTIFNLRYDGGMVPLLISPGEKVSVMSFGDTSKGYSISGSEESELVARVHKILSGGGASLDSISGLYAMRSARGRSDVVRMDLSKAWSAEYYRIKREQIRFIVEHSSSLAAIYALYQRLPGDEVLFNGDTDYVYYQMVADSVHRRYPDSRYLAALEREIEANRARRDLAGRLAVEGISESDYPDLELPNMYGQRVRLSETAGKLTVLDFWSAALPASNLNNADLKELWGEYADRGLTVYQVSLDTSKPLWVNAVQEQKLPWTTVCDFRGEGTMAVKLYNVSSIPANFIIDGEGNIVARDLYGDALVAKIEELL